MSKKKIENVAVVEEVKEVPAIEETKVVENAEKKSLLNIEEIVALYSEAGIKCYNPTSKGNYRIMGSQKGSSLNVKPKKGYYIYTTDADFAEISTSGLKADDLVVEEGTNSQDKSRPNTIICQTVETLKELLALYAMNPVNKVVAETTVAE